jgi:uncharacterized protein (TIGR00369 family)
VSVSVPFDGFVSARADRYEALDAETTARWMRYGRSDPTIFPALLGLTVEDVRADYCRMRMPFQPVLLQAAGVVHGGAIASLLDAVVVPAVGGLLPPGARFSTVDLHVQFLRALAGGDRAEDAVAEGWVVRRGRGTVFCESEVYGATTARLVAKSVLTYSVATD